MEFALSWLCIVSTFSVVIFTYSLSRLNNWMRLLTKAYIKANGMHTTDKDGNEIAV